MEILFNLIWLGLSAGLTGIWLVNRRRCDDRSRRTSICVQIIALALLIMILLPVVSLTDDLRACAAPTEAEHISRRGDPLTGHDLSLHAIAFAVTALTTGLSTPQMQNMALLAPEHGHWRPENGHMTISGIRPPPFFALHRA